MEELCSSIPKQIKTEQLINQQLQFKLNKNKNRTNKKKNLKKTEKIRMILKLRVK